MQSTEKFVLAKDKQHPVKIFYRKLTNPIGLRSWLCFGFYISRYKLLVISIDVSHS